MFSAVRGWVRRGLLVGAAGAVAAGAMLAASAAARPASPSDVVPVTSNAAKPRALRRCATFTVKRVIDGKVLRRRGKVVTVRRMRCVTVPAATCMVTWVKQRKHGRVVIRKHNPIYVAKVMCPRRHMTAPVAPPTKPPSQSQTPAGLGNAAVAVYDVTAQGTTFEDADSPPDPFPAQQIYPVESYTQHGYLVRLLTPFPGINGEAQDELGLWLGSLVTTLPKAATVQFATNTMMFSPANAGDPTVYHNLPYPFDIGQIAIKGDMLEGLDSLSDIEQITPPGGMPPIYFVDRSGAAPGQIKGVNVGAVLLQFPSATDTSSFTGVFELHGFASNAIGAPNPSEVGEFGVEGTLTGKLISPAGGQPIYLPPPLPTTPRPPGCRTELHLVPGLGDGTLSEQETVVCS